MNVANFFLSQKMQKRLQKQFSDMFFYYFIGNFIPELRQCASFGENIGHFEGRRPAYRSLGQCTSFGENIGHFEGRGGSAYRAVGQCASFGENIGHFEGRGGSVYRSVGQCASHNTLPTVASTTLVRGGSRM